MTEFRATVQLRHQMTLAELLQQFEGIPMEAVISVSHTAGDRPWDSDSYRLQISFDSEFSKLRTPGPHSRACGPHPHEHGSACHQNCPTCHGLGREDR